MNPQGPNVSVLPLRRPPPRPSLGVSYFLPPDAQICLVNTTTPTVGERVPYTARGARSVHERRCLHALDQYDRVG